MDDCKAEDELCKPRIGNSLNNNGITNINYISTAEKAIEATLLTLFCLVALVGNILLWLAILRKRSLRTPSNALILCLSSADVLVSIINMPFTIATIVIGDWVLGQDVCVITGFTNMITFIASVMSLGAISINRFYMIVHPFKCKSIYTKRNTIFNIIGIWLLSVFLGSPPLLGWAEYGYLPGQSFCFAKWELSPSYTIFMVITCFGGPCSAMTFSYVRLFTSYRKRRMAVGQTAETSLSQRNLDSTVGNEFQDSAISLEAISHMTNLEARRRDKEKKRREEDLKLSLTLFIVIVVFVVCWLPFCVTMFLNVFSEQSVSRQADIATLILGYCNSCCNPVIYGVTNAKLRSAYKEFWRVCLSKLRKAFRIH
ncbi:G-protein coupled receptor 161-like [Glandiceps talaboti]